MNQLLVSVVMITYGHEKYIDKAIRGVLMQQCNFDLELIIADDCSPDDTHKIVKNILQEKHQRKWIRYVRHTKNIGVIPNFIFSINQAKGKYVAFCEGDDYWINSTKLQTQINFLELNPEFVMTAHGVDEQYDNIISSNDWRWDKKRTAFSLVDYLYQLFFHTSTVVFRNMPLPIYLKNKQILHGDIALFSYILSKGKIKYFENVMSVYRKHPGGISNSIKHKNQKNNFDSKIFIYNNLNLVTNFKYNKFIECNIKMEKQIYLMHTSSLFTFYRIRYWFFKLYYRLLLILNSLK